MDVRHELESADVIATSARGPPWVSANTGCKTSLLPSLSHSPSDSGSPLV